MTKRHSIDATVSRGVSELNDYIRQFSEPSFDRWNNEVFLSVWGVPITRPFLVSMIEFLNLPFAKDPTGTTDKEKKWICVQFESARFDQDCTVDDVRRLFLAIAHRATQVCFEWSGDVLSRFLSICHQDDGLEVSRLLIDQPDKLYAQQFAQLGDLVQRSIHLKKLYLYVPYGNGAHEVFAALANAIELRQLSLWDHWSSTGQRKDLGDLVAGKNGYGSVIRLLRNPHNQLKELSLRNIGLKDHHLIAVLQSIPSTQIEYLDFSSNLIQMAGMLEFGNLLPKMKSLKTVHFERNSWEDLPVDDRTTIGTALVQGMMENMSIENMDGIQATLHARLLLHYIALNRAGRRVVQLSPPIVDGLWPLILAREGPSEPYYSKHNARANVIFYYLQNCPRILSCR